MNAIPHSQLPGRQRGISLVMSLIMLVVLTLIAVSATYSTNSSIRIVGNMQMLDESLTAAQKIIDRQLDKQLNGLNNFTDPQAKEEWVDINRDNVNDYKVVVAAPTCVASEPKPGNSAKIKNEAAISTYWDVAAVVEDSRTGARVKLNQGVKIDMLPYQGCL